MKRPRNITTDPVVKAIDRASQAQYRLEAFIASTEEAIKEERERIRLACSLEGGLSLMSGKLLRYLQQEFANEPKWARSVLGEVLELLNIKKLTQDIWPELRRTQKQH